MTTNGLEQLQERVQQLERDMLRERRFITSFIEQANIMVIGLDGDGRVTIFNRKAEAETGYAKGEVLGTMLVEVFHPEAGNTVHALLEQFKVSGRRGFRCETQLVTKTGEQKQIAWNASSLQDNGKVIGLMAFGDDLTALKRQEDRARWFNAMEMLQRFAGKLAHDFNNLLGTVLGYASMLRKETGEDEDYTEKVKAGVRRCAAVLERLLEFGSGGASKAGSFELGETVRRAVQRLQAEAPANIEVALAPTDRAIRAKADPTQVEAVLAELVRNAWEAMPEGGRVEVAAGTALANEDFCGERPGLAPGSYATLRVSDTGPGVLPEDSLRLLEPLTTSKRERCAGLGLAMAYGFVRRNGGWIELAGTPGSGTTATVYLPLEASKAETPTSEAEPPAPDEGERTGPRTILLVDDEEALVATVSEMLKHLGYLVLTAGDGEEAIRIYDEHKANVDLIVLDMIMPRKSGQQAYKDLKRIQPDVKVLFTSGFDGQKGVAKALCEEGAAGFVEKPFHMTDLAEVIRGVIEQCS